MPGVALLPLRSRPSGGLAATSFCLLVPALIGGVGVTLHHPTAPGRTAAPVAPVTAADHAAFAAAVRAGNGALAWRCLANGVSPRARRYDGCTALTLATAHRQYRLFPLLVAYGTPVNERDDDGKSALTRLCADRCRGDATCTFRQLSAVAWLLRHGADPNQGEAAGGAADRRPLMLATRSGNAAVCRVLRAHGAR